MASIIIDEIVPTKWRLRLRDPEGKTREVEVRAGTPLQLDVDDGETTDAGKKSEKRTEAPSPKEAREKPRAAAADRARTSDKPRAETRDKPRTDPAEKIRAADKSRTTDKPRTDRTRPAGKAQTPAKAEPTARAIEEKPAPEPPTIRRRKPEPGAGPGGLHWEPIDDDGVPGIRAPFERGAFKILHAGGDAHGLFYEWNSGKYQTLQCGPLDALKQAAARWTEDGKLEAPRSNLGAEAAKLACATKDEVAPAKAEDSPPAAKDRPTPSPPARETPPVDPEKDKILTQSFEASVQKLMAARKGAP